MALVELDIAKFRNIHSQFTEDVISDETITALWGIACDITGNKEDVSSFYPYDPEKGITTRAYFLDLILCHLCTLHVRPDGQSGRISSAAEGSVNTSFDLIQYKSETGAWWGQTPCGATYWTLSASYRKGGLFFGTKNYHPWG